MAVYFDQIYDGEISVDFTVQGAPQGKARPRVTRHGTYTPEKTKAYEQAVQLAYMMQAQGCTFPADAALMVVIDAYYPIPKSTSKVKRERMLGGRIRPTVKPDADNVAKAICDALNGEAWHDDAQICNRFVRKWYDDEPRCYVQIRTVNADES